MAGMETSDAPGGQLDDQWVCDTRATTSRTDHLPSDGTAGLLSGPHCPYPVGGE